MSRDAPSPSSVPPRRRQLSCGSADLPAASCRVDRWARRSEDDAHARLEADLCARASPERPLYYAFSELPSRDDYPDYYKMIKKPISFAEIKAKLDARASPPLPRRSTRRARTDPLSPLDTGQYACLSDLRTDINQIYVNAKRYNAPGSQIFLDAKKQHVRRPRPLSLGLARR